MHDGVRKRYLDMNVSTEKAYERVSLSEAQARAGLVKRGTADDLMAELNDVRKSGIGGDES